MAVLAALWILRPATAHAIEYEIFVDVDDEDDLYDLQATGQIDDSSLEELVELMRRGVDLETASREDLYALPNLSYDDVDRIIAYRQEAGGIADPADLVVAGVLTQRTLSSIAAFIVVPKPPGKVPVDGFIRYRTMWLVGDRQVPPMLLQARLSTLRYLTIGAAGVLDRTRPWDVRWDPNREALIADAPGPRARLPKAFVQWDTPNWGVIAGTYRIGFGQRLVFDNTSRYSPNGFFLDDAILRRQMQSTTRCRESAGELDTSPCAGEAGDERSTPDFYVRETLRGAAVGARKLPVDTGWVQAYGFGSAARRPIYQYQLLDAGRCADPSDGDDPACSAPLVYKRDEPRLDPTSRFSYLTLPNMYDEFLGGGNVSYFYNRRIHVGATGYGAAVRWVPDGVDLDFQDWARTPGGGPWGAVGADMAWGRAWADVFLEIARSFDSIDPNGGGGFAGIVRHTATWDVHEIEVSARVYDPRYANPYARAIAAPDPVRGLRNRDEVGGRVRYSAFLAKRLSLRTYLDVWSEMSRAEPAMRVFGRADVDVNKWWRPGLWLEYQTRDLRRDVDLCFENFEEDEAIPQCAGQRVSVTGRSRFLPHKRVAVTLQYRHDFQDDNYEAGGVGSFTVDPNGTIAFGEILVEDIDDLALRDRLRQDINTFVMVTTNPIDPLRLRTRWRWFWEDIADNTRFENSVWGYFDASYKIRPWAIPALRYDVVFYIDGRDSTADRQPNPEHWLSFQWTSRF